MDLVAGPKQLAKGQGGVLEVTVPLGHPWDQEVILVVMKSAELCVLPGLAWAWRWNAAVPPPHRQLVELMAMTGVMLDVTQGR